jgi:hypothetical protein
MDNILKSKKLVTLLVELIITLSSRAQPSSKPNVVFILVDNVSYEDMGIYGGGELKVRRQDCRPIRLP